MDNNKEMIEGLVSQILDDYHDDKIINQQITNGLLVWL